MKLFNKKENVIPVDENGNPIENKKKIDWKVLGTDLLKGLAWMAAGAAAFIAVGLVLVSAEDGDSETSGDSSEDPASDGDETGVANEESTDDVT